MSNIQNFSDVTSFYIKKFLSKFGIIAELSHMFLSSFYAIPGGA